MLYSVLSSFWTAARTIPGHGWISTQLGLPAKEVWPSLTVLSTAYKYTAILRKVVGKSARDNPERYCG